MPTSLAAPPAAAKATPSSTLVRSTWSTAPRTDGLLNPLEWSDAGMMKIDRGFLLAKNDATTVWLALDLVDDITPGTDDYFMLAIDVDGDGKPTPYRDLVFAVLRENRHRLGRWVVAGPSSIAQPLNPFAIQSRVREGFGPTQNSSIPHRIWELALKIDEIDPALRQSATPPSIRFCVRSSPYSEPPRNFAELATLFLAVVPKTRFDNPGAVIAGIGTISTSQIDPASGRATVRREADGFYLANAAFGGQLDFYANPNTLRALIAKGAKTFGVRYRRTDGKDPAPLMTEWTNYKWVGTKYQRETFGANARQQYRIVDPDADYAVAPLLFRCSLDYSERYEFEVDFYDASGAKMNAPSQRLALQIHNGMPTVRFDRIEVKDRPGDKSVRPGEIVTMSGPFDCLMINFAAVDALGFLEGYQLVAEYENQSDDVAQDFYTWRNGVKPNPTSLWSGVPEFDRKTVLYVVPRSGAYRFCLKAIARATDGYRQLGYQETEQTVVILQPYPDRNEHRVASRHIETPWPWRFPFPPGYLDDGSIAAGYFDGRPALPPKV